MRAQRSSFSGQIFNYSGSYNPSTGDLTITRTEVVSKTVEPPSKGLIVFYIAFALLMPFIFCGIALSGLGGDNAASFWIDMVAGVFSFFLWSILAIRAIHRRKHNTSPKPFTSKQQGIVMFSIGFACCVVFWCISLCMSVTLLVAVFGSCIGGLFMVLGIMLPIKQKKYERLWREQNGEEEIDG